MVEFTLKPSGHGLLLVGNLKILNQFRLLIIDLSIFSISLSWFIFRDGMFQGICLFLLDCLIFEGIILVILRILCIFVELVVTFLSHFILAGGLLSFILYFLILILYWHSWLIMCFRCTAKWCSYMYTCI